MCYDPEGGFHPGEYHLISAETSTNSALKELLANSYVSLRQYQAALETYKSLPVNKIHAFAQQQFSALNDEIALLAFEHLIAVNI